MNLSEIRKKAQQEKAGKVEVPAFTSAGIAPVDEAETAAGPEELASEDFGSHDIAEIPSPPLTSPEAASPQVFNKTEQEKAGGAPAEEEGTAEVSEEPAPEVFEDHNVAEIPRVPLTSPEARYAQTFDPLALLLAGRANVRNDVDMQSAELFKEHDDAEFQELLCFKVADEKYAVNIMEIKEIIKPREATEVPRVPPYVSGVLSLRGIIIPIINLRMRLGHAVVEVAGKERIIVVKKGEEFCGVMVDEVIQVVRIAQASIEPPPAVLDGIDRDFVEGIGRFDGQILILLNLARVIDLDLY